MPLEAIQRAWGRVASARDLVAWLLVAALVFAFLAPIPQSLLGLPEAMLRLDLVLVWSAFAISLLRIRLASLPVRILAATVVFFGLSQILTGLISGVAPAGWALSFSLLALPLAAIAAVSLSPPTKQTVRWLITLTICLAFLQIPFVFLQSPFATNPDEVKGTFLGLAIGHHLSGSIAGVAAIWLLGREGSLRNQLLAIPLLAVILLTETRQVAYLLPLVLALSPAPSFKAWASRLVLPVLLIVGVVISPSIDGVSNTSGRASVASIENTVTGPSESRKVRGVIETNKAIGESPTTLLFGLGQGQSIGFIALLGSPEIQKKVDSNLGRQLGLERSKVVETLGGPAASSSFQSEFSSAGGVWGDFGLIGSLIFLTGLASVAWLVFGVKDKNRGAIQALGFFYLGMGLVYIWWEQPVFTLYLALAIALGVLDARDGSVKGAEDR